MRRSREPRPATAGPADSMYLARVRSSLAITAAAALYAVACGAAPPPSAPPMRAPRSIAYEVALRSSAPWVIDVSATFEGGAERAAIAFPAAVKGLVVREGRRERAPEQVGRAWNVSCPD